jgi:hypothetical protein
MEIWKQIKGHDGYKVSNLGRIKGNSGKIITMRVKQNGYVDVSIRRSLDSRKVRLAVHKIVAQAFIPNPKRLKSINHKNLIKADNRLINLEWCTSQDNASHYAANESSNGELNASAVLTDKKVLEIRNKYATQKKSMSALAREYNVGETTISRVVHRTTWRHI